MVQSSAPAIGRLVKSDPEAYIDVMNLVYDVVVLGEEILRKGKCDGSAHTQGGETLPLECKKCGAKCSGKEVDDDNLCYDEKCALHDDRPTAVPPHHDHR